MMLPLLGQNKHGLSGDLIDPGQEYSPWRGSWSDRRKPRRRSKIPEHGGKPSPAQMAGSLRPFQGRLPCADRFPCQFFLNGVQIIGALGGLTGGQRVGLNAYSQPLAPVCVFLGFRQGCAGNVGMNVDLEGLVISPMTRLSPMLLGGKPAGA